MDWIGQNEQEEGNCPILSHGFDSKFNVWNPPWNKYIVITHVFLLYVKLDIQSSKVRKLHAQT